MSGQNLFAFAFSPPSGSPKMVSRITRADMGIILPRLDDPCLGDTGLPSPEKKIALNALIEKYRAVYVVGGQIVKTTSTKGKGDEPGVRFIGKFKGIVNPLFGGAWFISARCHVPKFFEEVLYASVVDAKRDDPDATLEFLIGVGIKPPALGKPSITGYEWTVDALVDMDTTNDPVDALFNRAKDRFALAAPTVQESAPVVQPAPTTEPAPTIQESKSEARGRNHRSSNAN